MSWGLSSSLPERMSRNSPRTSQGMSEWAVQVVLDVPLLGLQAKATASLFHAASSSPSEYRCMTNGTIDQQCPSAHQW